MNFLTEVLTKVCQLIAAIFSPLQRRALASEMAPPKVDESGKKKILTAVVAVLVIIGSGAWLYHSLMPRSVVIDRAPFVGVGEVFAEETVKALGDRGRIVLLIKETHQLPSTVMYFQYKAFLDSLKSHRQITVAATEVVKLTDDGPDTDISAAQFKDLIQKHLDADAIVSFIGMPWLPQSENLDLPKPCPKILTIQSGSPVRKTWLRDKVVVAVIGPRAEMGTTTTQPKTPHEWFDRYFQVYTAQNYASLPD